MAIAIGGDLADRVAIAVGEGHRAAGLGGTADRRAVAWIDDRCGRRNAIDGDRRGGAGIAGGILGHGSDHGSISKRRRRREAPVAARIRYRLADRIAIAIRKQDGQARARRSGNHTAIAGIHQRRVGIVGRLHRDRRTAVAGRIGHYHADRLALGQRWIQWHRELAVAADHHGGIGLAIAIGIHAHRCSRLTAAADAAAVVSHHHVAGRCRRCRIGGRCLPRSAHVAGGIDQRHADALAVGQRRRQGDTESPIGTHRSGRIRLPVTIGIDAHRGTDFTAAGKGPAVCTECQPSGCGRRRGIGYRGILRWIRRSATTTAAAVGQRHRCADRGQPAQHHRAADATARARARCRQRVEPSQRLLRQIAGRQRPIAGHRRQIDGHELLVIHQEQMAGRLSFSIEVDDADVLAALQLHHEILAVLHVAGDLVWIDVQCDVAALLQRHDIIADGGGGGIGADRFACRDNLDADGHGTFLSTGAPPCAQRRHAQRSRWHGGTEWICFRAKPLPTGKTPAAGYVLRILQATGCSDATRPVVVRCSATAWARDADA